MKTSKNTPVFTYQTRIASEGENGGILDVYVALYGKVERSLFAAMQKPGIDLNGLKRDFLTRFGMTSRQFNAMRIGLQGKIASSIVWLASWMDFRDSGIFVYVFRNGSRQKSSAHP